MYWADVWLKALEELECEWLLPDRELAGPLLATSAVLAKGSWAHFHRRSNFEITWPGSMLACCLAATGSDALRWEEESR